VIRAIATGVRIHVKQFTRNAFDLSGVILWPILYATIAYYLLDAKDNPKLLLAASLGSAVMTMWSIVVISSSGALENQRFQGTLELLVAAPLPFAVVLAPITIATAVVGMYSLVSTLLWGTLLFDVPLSIVHPLAFALAVPMCAIAVGMLGLILAATFVLYRASFHLGVSLQYPVWIVTGLLVPLSLLPAYVEPLSWILAPTWGFRAIRDAALGGQPWQAIGMCALLSSVYFVIATVLLRVFEDLARARATLRLT
jgi:ABC-2 type transport system permease protein